MENLKTKNQCDTDSIDIIKEITKFVFYLKNNNNCQTLLKLSEIELQNEIEFKQRAEKILKHRHCQDQITTEEKLMNEQQENIYVISSDMECEIDKEKLNPTNIAEIYQNMLTLKMFSIHDSKHVKQLEDFIKINKINLKHMSKIKKDVKNILYKLSSKGESFNRSDKKIAHTANTSNVSRRYTQDNNTQIQPRTYILRNYEDMASHDLTISSNEDDFIDNSSLNSTPNLSKDNEENNSGDVHLILNPFDI